MTGRNPQELIDELDTILDQERSLLLKGDLTALEPLVSAKDELIEALNEIGEMEQDSLSAVQNKVTRNQTLLTSAMEGIRTVAARMAELRKVRKGLDVYDKSGTRSSYSTQGARALEKRA